MGNLRHQQIFPAVRLCRNMCTVKLNMWNWIHDAMMYMNNHTLIKLHVIAYTMMKEKNIWIIFWNRWKNIITNFETSYHTTQYDFFYKQYLLVFCFTGSQIQKRSSPNSMRRTRGPRGYMVKFSSISSVPWYTYGPKTRGTSLNLLLTWRGLEHLTML
jgi:hypothetical protein